VFAGAIAFAVVIGLVCTDPQGFERRLNALSSRNMGDEPFTVNQYLVGDVLGSGAYGDVRLATTSSHGEKFAIKCLSKSFLKKQREFIKSGGGRPQIKTALEDVQREIAIMKKTQHPNLVTLIQAIDDEADDSLFIVLEFITGGQTMYFNGQKKRYFTADGSVYGEERAKQLFADMLQGINYLHEQGIIHRDIKPENLLLTGSGSLKIADFGIAQKLELEGDAATISTMKGTHHFMAPEVITEHKYSGFPVDIWAAGVCMFIFVNGELPFWGDNTDEVFEDIMNSELKPGQNSSPQLSKALAKILDKDPSSRATIEDIVADPYFGIDSLTPVSSVEVTLDDTKNAFTPRLSFAAMVVLKMKARSLHKQASERSRRNLRASSRSLDTSLSQKLGTTGSMATVDEVDVAVDEEPTPEPVKQAPAPKKVPSSTPNTSKPKQTQAAPAQASAKPEPAKSCCVMQ